MSNINTELFIELLKVNHLNDYKLPSDVLEIIFNNYVINSLEFPERKIINNFYTDKLSIIKILYKHNYKCSSYTFNKCVENNNIDIIEWLLENDKNNYYSMGQAIKNGNLEIIKLMIKYNITFLLKYVEILVENKYYYIIDYLLDNNINILEELKYELSYNYTSEGVNYYLKLKEKYGINININNITHHAIYNNDIKLVELLIDNNLLLLNNGMIHGIINLTNIQLIKLINDYIIINNIIINNVIKFNKIIEQNNLELLKYYLENQNTGFFGCINESIVYDDDIIVDGFIIKYLYENINIKLSNYLLFNSILHHDDIYLLEWLYHNDHIVINRNFISSIKLFKYDRLDKFTFDKFDIYKFMIDNLDITDSTDVQLYNWLYEIIIELCAINNLYLTMLIFNKIKSTCHNICLSKLKDSLYSLYNDNNDNDDYHNNAYFDITNDSCNYILNNIN